MANPVPTHDITAPPDPIGINKVPHTRLPRTNTAPPKSSDVVELPSPGDARTTPHCTHAVSPQTSPAAKDDQVRRTNARPAINGVANMAKTPVRPTIAMPTNCAPRPTLLRGSSADHQNAHSNAVTHCTLVRLKYNSFDGETTARISTTAHGQRTRELGANTTSTTAIHANTAPSINRVGIHPIGAPPLTQSPAHKRINR